MRFDDTRIEWRVSDVERTANNAESRLHELDTLRSDVGNLKHTNWELSSTCDGLRYELAALLERIERLEED